MNEVHIALIIGGFIAIVAQIIAMVTLWFIRK